MSQVWLATCSKSSSVRSRRSALPAGSNRPGRPRPGRCPGSDKSHPPHAPGREAGRSSALQAAYDETDGADQRRRQVPAFQQARPGLGMVKAEYFLLRLAVGMPRSSVRRSTRANFSRWYVLSMTLPMSWSRPATNASSTPRYVRVWQAPEPPTRRPANDATKPALHGIAGHFPRQHLLAARRHRQIARCSQAQNDDRFRNSGNAAAGAVKSGVGELQDAGSQGLVRH